MSAQITTNANSIDCENISQKSLVSFDKTQTTSGRSPGSEPRVRRADAAMRKVKRYLEDWWRRIVCLRNENSYPEKRCCLVCLGFAGFFLIIVLFLWMHGKPIETTYK